MIRRPDKAQALINRDEGASFEGIFQKQAQRLGLTVIKNWFTCRFLPGGRPIVIKGELDFKLITQTGRVGYFDCKSFDSDHFTYSMLSEDQVKRATLYNDTKVPSGFVVFFRKTNRIVYFSGHMISRQGPRSRFEDIHGLHLGRLEEFDVTRVIQPVRSSLRLTAV